MTDIDLFRRGRRGEIEVDLRRRKKKRMNELLKGSSVKDVRLSAFRPSNAPISLAPVNLPEVGDE